MRAMPERDGIGTLARIEGGHVVGETVHRMPYGTEDIQQWHARQARRADVRASQGIEPRGLARVEGMLCGERLSGDMQIRASRRKIEAAGATSSSPVDVARR
jgi:hypothetical protein